jgi:hypothetical protein
MVNDYLSKFSEPHITYFQLLDKGIEYIQYLLGDREAFEQANLIVGYYPTTSRPKRIAAISNMVNGGSIVPIIVGFPQDLIPPELDPKTGEFVQDDEQYAKIFQIGTLGGPSFVGMTLEQQVAQQALMKLVCNLDVTPQIPFAWATDVRGEVPLKSGRLSLTKTNDLSTQLEALNVINNVRQINGAVGIAYGMIQPDGFLEYVVDRERKLGMSSMGMMVYNRWQQKDTYSHGSQRFRIHIANLSYDTMMDYIKNHQPEICASGLVFNTFGAFGSQFVEGIELEDIETHEFQAVEPNQVLPILAGYPDILLQQMARNYYNKNNLGGNDLIDKLTMAMTNLQAIKNELKE